MTETIYTIPVNEAFDKTDGCPFCAMYDKLEENELDLILGASMMEPDIRIKTNEMGFCERHYDQMYRAKNRLSLALMLESHLDSVKKEIKPGIALLTSKAAKASVKAEHINSSCYVCSKIRGHLTKMIETACILWNGEEEFRKKFAAQPYFCLRHYEKMLRTAPAFIDKKRLGEFYKLAESKELAYISSLRDDISFFCKKFDYRYTDEPWGTAKDSVERTIGFLNGRPI
ncbi:MAG: hypothetical protein IJV00_09495 [Clostridia bacterium]|nr:hypothetical protein [Clostridia bacterium]